MRLPLVALGIALTITPAWAADQPSTADTRTTIHQKDVKNKDVVPSLLVQTTSGFSYENGKLTLKGVSPTTIVFADRPVRTAGHVPTKAVIDDWADGSSSFAKVPPNADFSTFTDKGSNNAVVVLRNPKLEGNSLTYDVRMLEGQLPANGAESSLFIDIVGMPRTPMSVAGVGRRTAARAVYR
jgi:hypothetical protein